MAWQFPITYRRLLRMGNYVIGWTHELTVGTLGSEVGFRSNNYGTLSPQNIDSTGINDLRIADTATTILELTFDGLARPRNPGSYVVTFPGGYGPYTLGWSGFTNDYRLTTNDTEFVAYLLSKDGEKLGIKLV